MNFKQWDPDPYQAENWDLDPQKWLYLVIYDTVILYIRYIKKQRTEKLSAIHPEAENRNIVRISSKHQENFQTKRKDRNEQHPFRTHPVNRI